MPEVSIVVPAYNRADLIGETLDSVLNQDYADWECLIVDDHSTDSTAEVCATYVAKDSRFKFYLNQRSKGAQGARNTGIDEATGKYLIFLDSDDLLSTDCLSKRLAAAQQNPNYDFYCFPTGIFKQTPGDTNRQWNYLNKESDDLTRFLNLDTPWQTSGVFWKADALVKLGYWDEKLVCYQDWDMHLRAVLHPELKYYKVTDQQTSSYYRLDNSSATISKSYKSAPNIQSQAYLIEKFYPIVDKMINASEEKRLAFARFVYGIASLMYNYVNKEQGVSILKDYLSKLQYKSAFIKSWAVYMQYRRNAKYPKVLRKMIDLVPTLYKTHNLLVRKSTAMSAVVEH